MTPSVPVLTASDAARRLGVSPKALRLYEERGLLAPARTAAGWRAYGSREMARAGEIAGLRALGFSLAGCKRVLEGDARDLEPALAAHQARLEAESGALAARARRVRGLRDELAQGRAPGIGEVAGLARPAAEPAVAFDLPWPWGGERFELRRLAPITYLTGPLGSGKTRLARRLAEALPAAAFLGPERLAEGATPGVEPAPAARIAQATAWLLDEGGSPSPALAVLLAALECAAGPLVVDMVEDGLDAATQAALIAHLRRRAPEGPPVILMTRSSAILDLEAVGRHEAIILCPANHAPPVEVVPVPGARGYEAAATCLGSPEIRARTAGTVARRPRRT